MAFIDKVSISIESGSGGNGCVSFRRERYVPRGGPDGGDGGSGGDVILFATTSVQDFAHLKGIHRFKARNGEPGRGARCHGKSAKDLVINVPPGTIVTDADTAQIVTDFDSVDSSFVIAPGGKGGRGNVHFKSSINQTPRTAEEGKPSVAMRLDLELKIIADVGLVGLPNAGKSTLLAAVSRAHPKIAAYPFTTLQPNIGVAEFHSIGRIVVADVPGLIEGAHRGVGLGHEFLRHIERTRSLVFVIDAASPDPVADFETLRHELEAYKKGVSEKPYLVVANKIDLPEAAVGLEKLREALPFDPVPVSALSGTGIDALLSLLETLPPGPTQDN